MSLRPGGKFHKKRGENEIYFINLDEKYFVEAGILDEKESSCILGLLQKLKSAGTLDKQLCILKEIAKNCTESFYNGNKTISDFCLKLLVHLYLGRRLESPLKHALQRLLNDFPNIMHDSLASNIATGVYEILNSATLENGCLPINVVEAIHSCFYNSFSVGVIGITENLSHVLQFLYNCVEHTLSVLRSQLSPASKLEVFSFVHEVLRILVCLLQKCQAAVKKCLPLPASDETVAHRLASAEGSVSDSKSVRTVLECLSLSVVSLMSYEDLPLDTVSNCGLVIVLISSFRSSNGWKKLLSWADSEHAKQLKQCSSHVSHSYQLSVCNGLLSVLDSEQLLCRPSDSEPRVIVQIFRQLINISHSNSVESALVLSTSRAIQQCTCCLFTCATNNCDEAYEVISLLLEEVLSFVWTHLEHYMDSVRHAAQGTLQHVVRTAVKLKSKECDNGFTLKAITESVMKIPRHRKSYYIGLSTLGVEGGCQRILDEIPNLINDLSLSLEDSSITAHVSTAYENLMLSHYKECGKLTEWSDTWLSPVVKTLPLAKAAHSTALEIILTKAVKCCPAVVRQLLVEQLETFSEYQLRIVLILLKIGRKEGVFSDNDTGNGMWHGLIEYRVLEEALYHRDENIRMIAFSLLVETHRSTEGLSAVELSLARIFLEYNVNTQLPYARQESLRLLKKLLSRLKDSSVALSRMLSQKNVEDYQRDVITSQLRSYNTFLLWLVDFSYASLFPGANFGRRGCSLQLLMLIHDIIGFDSNDNLLWSFSPPNVWTRENADVLLVCFKDTYESNKVLAYDLLKSFPLSALQFDDQEYVHSLFDVSLKLASSNRPPDCITASYILKLLVSFPSVVTSCLTSLLPSNFDVPSESGTIFIVTYILLRRLHQEHNTARTNLLLASVQSPMYGTLFCIRQLLTMVNFKKACSDTQWQNLIRELIELCFELNKIVSCIVNSSSPEGHLPMDFHHVDETSEIKNVNAVATLNVTAQMVLLCSWRTMKEVSLFLGEIAENSPIKVSGEGLLTEEQIFAIGDHFTTLLAETKHRGAFEQAYVGFCKLCSMLWKCSDGTLHQLPRTWLNELTTVIAGGGGGKLCATRRSAGVPFMVQALVTTQLQLGGSSSCFHDCMSTLLSLASTEGNTEKAVETRTHALNILRALYRHAALGELVTPYIAEGITIAIKGFNGKTWAERNSSTLLFSALVTRVFGVRRSREELSAKNRMTGRIFFHRYPSLFDFLLEELKKVSCVEPAVNQLQLFPSLFPVLLLLARLYPSSLEGTDSNLQLSSYVPYVHHCAGSAVLKTRVLAAQALVPLITPNIYVTHLCELFAEVSEQENVSHNKQHGILLQILYLLKNKPENNGIKEEMQQKIENWIQQTKWLITANFQNCCFVTVDTYIEILTCLCEKYFQFVSQVLWDEIYDRLNVTLFQSDDSYVQYIGRFGYEQQAAMLCVLIRLKYYLACAEFSQNSRSYVELETLLMKLLNHNSYEVVSVPLQFILRCFENVSESEDEVACSVHETSWEDISWDAVGNLILKEKFCSSMNVMQTLVNLAVQDHTCRRQVLHVLSHFENAFTKVKWFPQCNTEEIIKFLLCRCSTEHEKNVNVIISCIGMFIQAHVNHLSENVSPDLISKLVWLLYDFTSPEKLFSCRLSVAKLLLQNFVLLTGKMSVFRDMDLCTLWTSVLVLLHDDLCIVRESISALVEKLNPERTMPVIASKAREDLVHYFVDFMKNKNVMACVVSLLGWALRDSEENDIEDVPEERVFDKGEMNIYCEDVTVLELACAHLQNILSSEVLHDQLPPEMKDWFIRLCAPDLKSIILEEGNTLYSILKILEVKKGTCNIPTQFRNSSASHFLVPAERSMLLSALKIRRVLQLVSQR